MNRRSDKNAMLYIHHPNRRIADEQNVHVNASSDKSRKTPDENTRTIKKRSRWNDEMQRQEGPYEEKRIPSRGSQSAVSGRRKHFPIPPDQDVREEETVADKHKPFKDRTLKEKVDYFTKGGSLSAQMRCEVKTNGQRYRGRIVGHQDGIVSIRQGSRITPVQIPFTEITDIRLLGF